MLNYPYAWYLNPGIQDINKARNCLSPPKKNIHSDAILSPVSFYIHLSNLRKSFCIPVTVARTKGLSVFRFRQLKFDDLLL